MQVIQYKQNKSLNDVFIKSINDGKTNKFNQKKGEIIKATIISRENDMVNLKTRDNLKFQAHSKNIAGDIGDELIFEVSENSKNGISLKQIYNDPVKQINQNRKQASQEDIIELLKQHNMANDENILNPKNQNKEIEEQKKIMLAKAKIQRTLSYTANNVSQSAINELIANGLSLEKISINILNNVMKEIEDKPPQELSDGNMDEIVSRASAQEINQKIDFSKKLDRSNLPVNDKNIKLLETVVQRLDEIKDIDKAAISNIIKSERPVTLENVYKAKFSSADAKGDNLKEDIISDSDLNSLKTQIDKILLRDGIENNDNNISAAKFLVKNELAATKENIDKFNKLNNIEKNIDFDKIIQSVIKNIKKNDNPFDVELFGQAADYSQSHELIKSYKNLMDELPNINPQYINVLLKKHIPLTLNNLRNETSDIDSFDTLSTDNDALPAQIISAKRQLAQIQLKMTREAAVRLVNRNININTMPLEDALKELENIESIAYAKSLKIMGAPDTSENLDKMAGLFNKVADLKWITNNAYGDIIMKKANFTIQGVSDSIIYAKVAEDLENFATVANPKYGDSFVNVKEQFKPFLENIGLDSTEENIKAASILSRNNMNVTRENVIKVNTIDSKLDRIQNTLHPNIAANMIVEGLNPAEMHIDEVLDYIDKFNGIFGEDLSDKISKHIMEMDDNNSIDKDTRGGMIAIYRMLNAVRTNESIAVGVTVKNGINLTLGNLLDASEYYKSTRGKRSVIDVTLDEKTGGLASLNIPETNIKNILSKAYANALESMPEADLTETHSALENNFMGKTADNIMKANEAIKTNNPNEILPQLEFNIENIKTFAENATPSKLIDLMQKESDIKLQAMSDLANELKYMNIENNVNHDNTIKASEFVQNIANSSYEIVHWMDQNGVLLTLNNIVSAKNILKDPFFISNKIEEIIDENNDEELMDSLETIGLNGLKSGINPLKMISNKLKDIKHNLTGRKSIENINILQNAIQFQSIVTNKTNNNKMQIPLKMHNKICGLNMYVLNDRINSAEIKKIYMSLNTKNLGDVQIYIKTNDKDNTIKVTSDNTDAIDFLRNDVKFLQEDIESLYGKNTVIEFDTEDINNIVAEEIVDRGGNDSLTSQMIRGM